MIADKFSFMIRQEIRYRLEKAFDNSHVEKNNVIRRIVKGKMRN